MKTVIDLIESVVGEQLTPDTLVELQAAPDDLFIKLREAHRAFQKDYTLPELRSDEIRPYVPVARQGSEISGIRISYYGDFDSTESAEMATDALIQHLLYCHSIAIDNPLAYMLDYFPTSEASQRKTRPKIHNYLHFLCSIRPLVDEGIVHLVEWWHGKQKDFRCWPPILFDENDATAAAKNAAWEDMQDFFKPPVASVPIEAKAAFLTLHVGLEISAVLAMSKGLGGNFDLYLPRNCYQALFRQLVRQGNEVLRVIRPKEQDMLLTAELLAVEIPRLSSLSLSDLVAIRRQEEVFEEWRRTLRRGLRVATQLDPHLLGRKDSALEAIRDELGELGRRVGVVTARSRILNSARQGAKGFAVNALAGIVTSPASVGASLAAGTAKGALEFLWNHLTAHTAATKAKASLQRHILACSP